MSIRFSKWTVAIMAGLLSFESYAEPVATEAEPKRLISFSFGLADTSGNYADNSSTPVSSADLNYSSSPSFSLAWGIEEGYGRILLEYYRADVEVDSPPFTTGGQSPELQIQSLYYSGYWTPDIYWGIKGILGAGAGYSQLTLDGSSLGKLEDGGLSFKVSAGLEYGLLNNLTIYLLAEMHRLPDTKDYTLYPSEGDVAGGTAVRTTEENEQTRVALGFNLRY